MSSDEEIDGKAAARKAPGATAKLLLVADLSGTLVFAIEGALAATGGGFDLLGVSVLAFSTALGGGIVRDLLLGVAPPNAVKDQRYPITAFVGAFLVVLFHPALRGVHPLLMTALDALGLSLCAVAGAEKALLFRVPALMAVLLGAVTGTGGGTIRDLLMGRSPGILHSDVYATAAMAGALGVVLGQRFGLAARNSALVGGTLCFVLRMLAVHYGWALPKF